MSAQYHQLTHHVAMRDGLPSAIRPTLLEEAEQNWAQHPRFAGKARFFMNIHRQLLDGSDWLSEVVEGLLDVALDCAKQMPGKLPRADIVEVCPQHDPDDVTARVAAYLARNLLLT